jgi:hypothetical protein
MVILKKVEEYEGQNEQIELGVEGAQVRPSLNCDQESGRTPFPAGLLPLLNTRRLPSRDHGHSRPDWVM